jgi:hypothetical protein
MVNFSVFNELSLPLNRFDYKEQFTDFFKILSKLKETTPFNMIRMDNDFKDYEILQNVSFSEFLGQEQDIDFKRRVSSFIANGIIKIDTPIIKDDEDQHQEFNNCDYFYNKKRASSLACSEIWNTIAISFHSNEWSDSKITLKKETLIEGGDIRVSDISIKHISLLGHIEKHKDFFNDLNDEVNLNISKNNLWSNKDKYFPNIIKFCPEVEESIKKVDDIVFGSAITILRAVELNKKNTTDYNWSSEGITVRNNKKMKDQRMFSIQNEKIFFESHIKSLPNANRIYFKKIDDKIYIGYIGKHLTNKRDK